MKIRIIITNRSVTFGEDTSNINKCLCMLFSEINKTSFSWFDKEHCDKKIEHAYRCFIRRMKLNFDENLFEN
jgi:hypothetical protein